MTCATDLLFLNVSGKYASGRFLSKKKWREFELLDGTFHSLGKGNEGNLKPVAP